MEKFEIIPGGEILDKIVEGALWLGHLVTRRHVSVTPSEHFREPVRPHPIHLNRWENEEYTLFDESGNYHDPSLRLPPDQAA